MTNAKKPKAIKGKTKPAAEAVQVRTRLPGTSANNIRNWRVFRKIETQKDLSDITKQFDPDGKGLDRVSICRLETGELRYNQDHLYVLSLALGVSERDLIGTNPFDAGDIFAVYAGLSDTDKKRAAKLISKLKR